MKVLAYMNTARWGSMGTTDREEAVQCPCEGSTQNVEHVMSECEYMLDYLLKMFETVNSALQTEPEAAQRKWLRAHTMGEKVAATVGTEMGEVSPDTLGEVAAILKLLIRRAEQALRIVNKAGESWPVSLDSLAVWAPDGDGPQMKLRIGVAPPDDQQTAVA